MRTMNRGDRLGREMPRLSPPPPPKISAPRQRPRRGTWAPLLLLAPGLVLTLSCGFRDNRVPETVASGAGPADSPAVGRQASLPPIPERTTQPELPGMAGGPLPNPGAPPPATPAGQAAAGTAAQAPAPPSGKAPETQPAPSSQSAMPAGAHSSD